MHSGDTSIIGPARFLPTAERYNLITNIDRWMVKNCVLKLSQLDNVGKNLKMLSINISGASLSDPKFLKYVKSVFDQYSVATEKICFEITETVAVSNLVEANSFIKYLRDLGCKFALDDFGTGFSSLESLKHLPVDFIKIDGVFVRDIDTNAVDHEMVRSLHKIAKLMNIETIAEFVETINVLDTLRDIGVNYVQGFAISEPMLMEEMLNFQNTQTSQNIKFAS